MALHLAVWFSDGPKRGTFEPVLAQHGTLEWCDSIAALERAVATDIAIAILELSSIDGPETPDVLRRLRQAYPGLLLVVLYDPVGEELTEAAKLARLHLGLWFACEPDAELELLLSRAAAGRIPRGPTPAELAVECVAELSPGPAARHFAWFCGLTPAGHLDEVAVASRCGEKLRTVQRQFAEIGVMAGSVRRAFQTLHAAFWLRGDARHTDEIAIIFGRRSARALREGVKGVIGLGVQKLRRSGAAESIGLELVTRLRSVPSDYRFQQKRAKKRRAAAPRYRVAPRITVTLTGDTIVASLKPGTNWVLPDVTGGVLLDVMQGRSWNRILARFRRYYRLTAKEARAALEAAVSELSAHGVIELDQGQLAGIPL